MDEYDEILSESRYTDDDALNILMEVHDSLDRGVPTIDILRYIDAYLSDIGRL